MRSEAAFGAAKEALLKADEELRRKHGLPLRRVLRDAAESLSTAQSEPLRQHRHAGFLDRAVLSDPFSGIATPVESSFFGSLRYENQRVVGRRNERPWSSVSQSALLL
jgi:hypothetical protein